jgi:hypothetical protein
LFVNHLLLLSDNVVIVHCPSPIVFSDHCILTNDLLELNFNVFQFSSEILNMLIFACSHLLENLLLGIKLALQILTTS